MTVDATCDTPLIASSGDVQPISGSGVDYAQSSLHLRPADARIVWYPGAMRRLAASLLVCLACGSSGSVGETGGSSGSPTATTGAPGSESGASTGTTDIAVTGSGLTPTTSGGEASSGGSGEGGEMFVPDCHTQLLPGPRLGFVCDLPFAVDACAQLPNAPCDDLDADGLADAWEDLALAALRPLRRMDEAEQLLTDPTAVIGDVGRVARVGEHLRIHVMLGYSIDYGSCGFTGHHGDSERIALDLIADPDAGAGGVRVVGAYTAAHENTASDHGRIFVDADLDQLVYSVDADTGDPRWVVYPSADKHATYATLAICENISAIPCLDEDCGPDDVDEPAKFDLLPAFVNAGEETAPRATELSVVGFPGEQAWADQDFCGGLGGTGCSSPVREKLLVDPF